MTDYNFDGSVAALELQRQFNHRWWKGFRAGFGLAFSISFLLFHVALWASAENVTTLPTCHPWIKTPMVCDQYCDDGQTCTWTGEATNITSITTTTTTTLRHLVTGGAFQLDGQGAIYCHPDPKAEFNCRCLSEKELEERK